MNIVFELQSAIHQLQRTPEVIRYLISGVPEAVLSANEGPGTWSPVEVLGHLIYGEQEDWLPRTRIILEFGTDQPFEPFDRTGHEAFIKGKKTEELLEEFSVCRTSNVKKLQEMELSSGDLQRKGVHPEFGEISLKQMLAAWVVHDLGHINQIARVIAKAYHNEIGPWSKYLTIVRSFPAPEG